MNLPGSVSANLKIARGVDVSRITTFVAPIFGIIVSVLVSFLIVYPKISEALRLRASNEELAIRVGTLAAKAQFLSGLDKVLLDTQLGAAEALLPSDKSPFVFIREIESAAGANGVVLNKVDIAPGPLSTTSALAPAPPAPGAVSEPAAKIQVRVSTTSTYGSLLGFLSRLYGLSRVVGIRDLTIAAGSADQPSALRGSMVVDAYWKSLPTDLGSVEAPVESLTAVEAEVLKRVKAPEAGAAAPSGAVPSVPTGRPDLFAPF